MSRVSCRFVLATMALVMSLPSIAQNPQKGDYGYLYCHMSDQGEYTAYALSRDGYHYEDVLEGKPIMDPKEHARTGRRRPSSSVRSGNPFQAGARRAPT